MRLDAVYGWMKAMQFLGDRIVSFPDARTSINSSPRGMVLHALAKWRVDVLMYVLSSKPNYGRRRAPVDLMSSLRGFYVLYELYWLYLRM
jgi:hypothetical protein